MTGAWIFFHNGVRRGGGFVLICNSKRSFSLLDVTDRDVELIVRRYVSICNNNSAKTGLVVTD